jgi:hypothetical protein
VFLAFGAFAVVVGPRGGVGQRGERGQEECALAVLLPPLGGCSPAPTTVPSATQDLPFGSGSNPRRFAIDHRGFRPFLYRSTGPRRTTAQLTTKPRASSVNIRTLRRTESDVDPWFGAIRRTADG